MQPPKEQDDMHRAWDESRQDRRNLHDEVRRIAEENEADHRALHEKLDALKEQVQEALDMLRIGKAGIGFLKLISTIGAAVAVIWTAAIEIIRHHRS